MPVNKRKTKVLLITGSGRSGSTILDSIIGRDPDVFSGGEINFFWDRGVQQNRPCACGEDFKCCSVWGEVTRRFFEQRPDIKPEAMAADAQGLYRMRFFPLIQFPRLFPEIYAKAERYADVLRVLYSAIADVTGSSVIVDSSKTPMHGFVLSLIPTLDVKVLHLVRDPRAVAFSWKKKWLYDDSRSDPIFMKQFGAVRSTVIWNFFNYYSLKLAYLFGSRYRLLKYEDFTRTPEKTLDAIYEFIDTATSDGTFSKDGQVLLPCNHIFSGNPVRFQQGTTQIVPDLAWETQMPRLDKSLVAFTALPLMKKFGYI